MDDFTTSDYKGTDKHKFLQLLLLRCIPQDTFNFTVIFRDTENFILILEDCDDTAIITLHLTSEIGCVGEGDFVGDGPFSLNKCLETTKLYKPTDTKVNYFIFTNRPMVKLKFFTSHDGKYNFLNCTTLYRVNLLDKTANIFITQVPLCINSSINETFQKFVNQYTINNLDSQLILQRFYDCLRYNQLEHLTKHDVMLTLLDLCISKYKIDLDCRNHCKFYDLWNDIICDKHLVIVKSDCVNDTFLISHTAALVAKFGDASLLAYKNLWFQNQVSLLVHAQSLSDYSDIINIFKMFGNKLRVTILSNCVVSEAAKCNLNGNQIKLLLKSKINLQGKSSMCLEEYMDVTMLRSLSYDDIIRLITGNLVIDYYYKELPQYYVERLFFKNVIRLDALMEVKDEVFVIKCKTGNDNLILKNLRDNNLPNVFIVQDNKTKVIENAKSRKLPIHFLIFKGENWLEWINSWGSTESIQKYNISEEVRNTCGVTDLIEEKRNVNLLVIDRFMGGSTLLHSIALNLRNDWVITIRLHEDHSYYENSTGKSALDHLRHFYDHDNSELVQRLFERFVSMKKIHILLDGYDKVPLKYISKVIEVIVCLQEAGFNLWLIVTSKNVSKLQKYLNTFPTIVRSFNEQDQINFLFRYFIELWEFRENIQGFVENLLKAIPKEVESFLKFPPYLKFLGNIFMEKLKNSCITGVSITEDNFDLLHFMEMFMGEYESWLVEQYDDSIHTFFNECYPLLALEFVFDKNDLKCLEIHKKCDNIGNMRVLIKEGILTDDGLEANFAHPIMADYLAAKWMYENIRSSHTPIKNVNVILYKRRFFDLDRYRGVFKMFDYMLAKDQPLHAALIKGKFNKIKSILTSHPHSFYKTDAGGRNIVHMAALYGVSHLELQNNLPIDMEDHMERIIQLADLRAIETEDALLGCSTLDYALGVGCLAVANAICKRAPSLTCYIYIPLTLLASYFQYCMRIDRYKYLYKNLLKYTVCFKVATDHVYQNTKIDSFVEQLNFNEMTTDSILYKLAPFNVLVLSHLIEKLQLKKADSRFYNSLHLASAFGTKQNILDLLKAGAKINNLHNFSHTPLHAAIIHKNTNNVDTLLSAGATVNIVDIFGNTPLHLACQYANSSLVKKLIQRGADISIENCHGDTPLHHALKYSQQQNAALFLPDKHYELFLLPETSISCDRCLDINMQNKSGDAPLMLALQHNCAYIVAELLKYQADVHMENRSKNTCLHYAAQFDDYNTVLELLYLCVNINVTNEEGLTPLLTALKNRAVKIAKLLITKGASVTVLDNRGMSCLHYAVTLGFIDLVETLLNKGADINKQNCDGETSAMIAILCYRPNIARYLLNKGADVNVLDKNGNSLLHHVARKGLKNLTRDLVTMGCDLNVRNVDGETPFILALRERKVGVARLLLTSDIDVTVVDKDGSSCLHLAVCIPALDLVKKIVAMGVDINKVNDEGNTPLLIAAQKLHRNIFKFLLENGADIAVKNRIGYSCLHHVTEDNFDFIDDLISMGADVNEETLRGDTPLNLYIRGSYVQLSTVKLLVNSGADVSKIHRPTGNSCLHFAANKAESAIVEYLLTMEVSVDLRNDSGDTALHLAVKRRNVEITELLLAYGADITITDYRSGNTYLHNAVTLGNADLVKALIKYGADVNATNNNGDTPLSLAERLDNYALLYIKILIANKSAIPNYSLLFSAVKSGELHTVKMLLREGCDINKQDINGNTPILLALEYNQIGIADFLLCQSPDVTIPNHNGTTCLHNAARIGDLQITRQLLKKGCLIDAINADGETPLQLAIVLNYIHIAQLLLDHNANIDVIPSSNDRGSYLHCACKVGADEIVDYILRSGFYIDKLNRYGSTPLLEALGHNQQHIAISLIEHGADITLDDDSGQSPLVYACNNHYLEIISLLIDRGADINRQTLRGITPLVDATTNYNQASAMLLIRQGADVNIFDNEGNCPLHLAVYERMDTVVAVILDQDFDVNTKNSGGVTALHNTSSMGSYGIYQMLIAKGANFDALHDSQTLLDFAITHGYEDLVINLIKNGINIHYESDCSKTPMICALERRHVNITKLLFATLLTENYEDDELNYLHCAAKFGDNKIVTSLLNNGYDINKEDTNGATPLLLALRHRNIYTAKLLISKGAKYFNSPIEQNDSYLYYFVQFGWDDLVLKILQAGLDVNTITYNNEPALFVAVKNKNVSTIKLLLSNGADLFINNYLHQTIFHYAMGSSYKLVLEALFENIDVNKFKNEIKPVIFNTLRYRYFDLAEVLMKYSIDDLTRDSGQTMLHMCVREKQHSLALELLRRYGNIDESNLEGDTPILLALANGDESMIKLLMEYGPNLKVINKKGFSCLHYAVCNSDVLKAFLWKKHNIDLKNNDGLTPLLFAIKGSHTDSAQLLITYGASVDVEDLQGNNCLHYAVKAGAEDLLKKLIGKGLDVKKLNKEGYDCLDLAMDGGHLDIMKLLVNHGMDAHRVSRSGETCLLKAVENNDNQFVEELLEMGVDVNVQSNGGHTPFTMALTNSNITHAQMLLSKNANVGLRNKSCSNLHYSISQKVDVVEQLLDMGLRINEQDKNGNTPLLLALQTRSHDYIQLLLKRDANIHIRNNDGNSCLHYAIEAFDDGTVLSLLTRGADVNKRNVLGETPLLTALIKGNLSNAKVLLEHGASCNVYDNKGNSCLFYAAQFGFDELITDFISKGADINYESCDGVNPFLVALKNKQVSTAKLLIENGADVYCLNRGEKIFSNYIMNCDEQEINDVIQILLGKGININGRFYENKSMLISALENKKRVVADFLIANGADIYATCYYSGSSCLHYAAAAGFDDIIADFLDKGLDIDRENNMRHTPLRLALMNRKCDTVKVLLSRGASVDDRNCSYSYMHYAAKISDKSIILQLVNKGADLNRVNHRGETPLQLALKVRKLTNAKLLHECGADCDASDLNLFANADIQGDGTSEDSDDGTSEDSDDMCFGLFD